MIATTESGSRYEFNADWSEVRRVSDGPMRRDEEWLKAEMVSDIHVGHGIVMWLEPLGEGSGTLRTTSPVVRIDV